MSSLLRVLGILLYIASGFFGLGFYVNWIDEYFAWRIIAWLIAIITLPFGFFAPLVEWVWHGVGAFWLITIYGFLIAGYLSMYLSTLLQSGESEAGDFR
jgi:hypothetical protein